MTDNRIPLFVFSGTGNTQMAAEILSERASERSLIVDIDELTNHRTSPDTPLPSVFGLMYPIYGGGSPRLVRNFVRTFPEGEGQDCFIVMTSAGAGHFINHGAADVVSRILRRRGYRVRYVRALAMPSNWLFSTPGDLSRCQAALLPEKCEDILDDLEKQRERRPQSQPLLHLFTALLAVGEGEIGARIWGRLLKAGDTCNGCGKCERGCAVGNIRVSGDSSGKTVVEFGWKCQWCMRCVYECPTGAIAPRLMKSAVLPGGYNLKQILDFSDDGKDMDGYLEKRAYMQTYLDDTGA